jgi:aminomethyltransferase
MWSPAAKASIALASVAMPWGRPDDELYAEIYYQKELKWSRVLARCRVVSGAFYDPARRRMTPAPDF